MTPTGRLVLSTARNSDGINGAGRATATHLDVGAIIDSSKLLGFDGILRVVLSDRMGHAINERYTGGYVQSQAYWGQGQNFRFSGLS